MSLNDPFDHGKSETCSLAGGCTSGAVYLIESFPDMLQVLRRNPNTVILKAALNTILPALQSKSDMAIGLSLSNGIVDQIDEEAHQPGFLGRKV